jgi:DNA helicase-2/ATP-dependent DNA helicase PcrA
MLALGICTHDEVRQVLQDALANPNLREVIADQLLRSVRAVIVDEVFDGNRLDLEIVKLCAEAGIPTTLIGDPWQALYEFRGAEPDLVPGVIADLHFEPFPVSGSFRFQTDETESLAERLRLGLPNQLLTGSANDSDVVLASHWRPLWDISDNVLPLAFGQIRNRTDAAMTLLLDPVASAVFGQLARSGLEAAVALGLDTFPRMELSEALIPIFERLAGAHADDAAAALRLLRITLRDIGGRNIPALAAPEEEKRIDLLLAFSKRLGKSRLVPGLTIHQAKGREWRSVGVQLTPGQQGRLLDGLIQDQGGDRALYVALTRARERIRLLSA